MLTAAIVGSPSAHLRLLLVRQTCYVANEGLAARLQGLAFFHGHRRAYADPNQTDYNGSTFSLRANTIRVWGGNTPQEFL
jgi:hypothetical protein